MTTKRPKYGRQLVPGRQRHDQVAVNRCLRAPSHDQAAVGRAREGGKRALDLIDVAHADRAQLHAGQASSGACERAMTRDGTVGRSDATERSLTLRWDVDPVRMMRPRFADSIRASSRFGLHQQAGHMTASDLCAARQIISCQAGGRGRDGDFSPPPAQIPAGAANAPGSHLGW